MDLTVSAATNKNQLLDLGGTPAQINTNNRIIEGYPMFAWWGRPITGWEDKDSNGILTYNADPALNEVFVGDSATILGYATPRYQMSITPGIDLFNRKLRISALIDRRDGNRYYNNTERIRCASRLNCQGLNDPNASFEDQAMVVAALIHPARTNAGFMQPGAFTKLREISASYQLPPMITNVIRSRTRRSPSRHAMSPPGRASVASIQRTTSRSPAVATSRTTSRPSVRRATSSSDSTSGSKSMRSHSIPFLKGRQVRRVGTAVAAALLGACSTDTLLQAPDPDLVTPETVTSAEGANAVYVGALDRFRNVTGGAESSWLFGGLLADEWSTSSTFIQNDETDQRRIQENNSSVTGQFRNLNRVRTATNQAIGGLATFSPTRVAERAEMYFARGFAEMQLAQDFCNGIPLSDGTVTPIVFGSPQTVAEVFNVAIASYDSATALVTGRTDAPSIRVERAARIAKARALLGLGNASGAATALAAGTAIATTYAYEHTFIPGSGDNTLWSQPFSAARYIVGDSLEGNPPTLLPVANAIGFSRAADPRLPVSILTTKGQDGQTNVRRTTLWARSTYIPVVNGIDARLIEAEARAGAE